MSLNKYAVTIMCGTPLQRSVGQLAAEQGRRRQKVGGLAICRRHGQHVSVNRVIVQSWLQNCQSSRPTLLEGCVALKGAMENGLVVFGVEGDGVGVASWVGLSFGTECDRA